MSKQLLRLDTKVSKNRWHIKMLEQINRLIDNDSLEVEKLNEIQEDIDYFVECMENDDCDGLDDDYNIYEDLQLDSLIGSTARGGMGGGSDKDKDSDATESSSSSSSSSSSTSKAAPAVAITDIGKKAVVPNPTSTSSSSATANVSPTKGSKVAKGATKTSTTKTIAPTAAAVTSTPAPASEGKTRQLFFPSAPVSCLMCPLLFPSVCLLIFFAIL